MEKKSFPVHELTSGGQEYFLMEGDVFVDFSIELAKYVKRINKAQLHLACQEYEDAKKYKRKRLRGKKGKQALLQVYAAGLGALLRGKKQTA